MLLDRYQSELLLEFRERDPKCIPREVIFHSTGEMECRDCENEDLGVENG